MIKRLDSPLLTPFLPQTLNTNENFLCDFSVSVTCFEPVSCTEAISHLEQSYLFILEKKSKVTFNIENSLIDFVSVNAVLNQQPPLDLAFS